MLSLRDSAGTLHTLALANRHLYARQTGCCLGQKIDLMCVDRAAAAGQTSIRGLYVSVQCM